MSQDGSKDRFDDVFDEVNDACAKWFGDHAARHIELAGPDHHMVSAKLRHTQRVQDHVLAIIKEAKPSRENARCAELAALLHDAARFPQLVRTASYDDHTGYNHAEAGARIVADAGLLDPLPERFGERVLTAIGLHNLGVLPTDLDPEDRLVLDILRNADKLDALRNCIRYLDPKNPKGRALKSGMTFHPTNVSRETLDLAMNRQLIPFGSIVWSNDYTVFLCCWLYDLHFHCVFERLKTSGIYETLLGKLPDGDPFDALKTQLRDDLDWIERRSRP